MKRFISALFSSIRSVHLTEGLIARQIVKGKLIKRRLDGETNLLYRTYSNLIWE